MVPIILGSKSVDRAAHESPSSTTRQAYFRWHYTLPMFWTKHVSAVARLKSKCSHLGIEFGSQQYMRVQMAIHRNEVGNNLYVWSTNHAGQSSQTAVISAHGKQTLIKKSFTLSNVVLHYYAPHGHILDTYSTTDFLKHYRNGTGGTASPHETYKKDSEDYVLEKFQGTSQESLNNLPFSDTYDDLRNLPDHELCIDVVTIRNREKLPYLSKVGFGSSIQLSKLIETLQTNNFNYSLLLCNFCRGPQLNPNKAPHTFIGAAQGSSTNPP